MRPKLAAGDRPEPRRYKVIAVASSALRSAAVPGLDHRDLEITPVPVARRPQRRRRGVQITVRHLSVVDATELPQPPPQRPARLPDVIQPGLPASTPDPVQPRARRDTAVPASPAQVLPGRPVPQDGRRRGSCWRCHLATVDPHAPQPLAGRPSGVPGEPPGPRTRRLQGLRPMTSPRRRPPRQRDPRRPPMGSQGRYSRYWADSRPCR
jgi:hypothetical protein